uniref:Uncharacterized protein n=1 Tax=Arundo donax TaxID=35708 RepID=A0A0A9EP49_ARUDO
MYHAPPSTPRWNSADCALGACTRPVHQQTGNSAWVPRRST